jgi:hypothetical protein
VAQTNVSPNNMKRDAMSGSYSKHKWTFAPRFRRQAFGWRSQPAIGRIREAVSEIKKTARKDPILGAEGAVLFIERVSPAIENVDGSSGAIGTSVRNAIAELAPIVARAPADDALRDRWLELLWRAVEADHMPYIESLQDFWGEMCAAPERASRWAEILAVPLRKLWGSKRDPGAYFHGTTACLSALYAAGRYDEILALLKGDPWEFWPYRKWGVKALVALDRKAEAIQYAEASRRREERHPGIAAVCEAILLSSGLVEEAYTRYAIEAGTRSTRLATFRAVMAKYPDKDPAVILADLVASTPGDEGKWFAAAREAGLLDTAIDLANRTPCDPRTLTRAARDMAAANPSFSIEAGMAALRWLVEGYGYEITWLDVWGAYHHTMKAAENAGRAPETRERIRHLVASETFGTKFVTKVLGAELGLDEG